MSSVTDLRTARAMRRLTPEHHAFVRGELPKITWVERKIKAMFPQAELDEIKQVVGEEYCNAAIDADPTRSKEEWSAYAKTRALGRAIDTFRHESRHKWMHLAQLAFGEVIETFRFDEDDDESAWAMDEEIRGQLLAVAGEAVYRAFCGSSFETWRHQGEQGLVDHLTRRAAFQRLQQAFSSLTTEEWKLLDLYYIDCLTWAQVGAVLGVQERGAQKRAGHVRDKLRRELQARGIKQAPPEAY